MSQESEIRRLRSQVLTIATRVGIHDINDWDVFNRFMIHKSVNRKTMNMYSLEELKALVKQFRGIEANFNKSAENKGTKAYYKTTGLPKPSAN